MTQHVHFDMAQIEAMILKSREELAPYRDDPGVEGTHARLHFSVGAEACRQMAMEANRGTSPDQFEAAFVQVLADCVNELVLSVNNMDKANVERRAIACGNFMGKLHIALMELLGENMDYETNKVWPTKSGSA